MRKRHDPPRSEDSASRVSIVEYLQSTIGTNESDDIVTDSRFSYVV